MSCTLDTILKHAFKILQPSEDNRENLHAMELFKDTHLLKLELLCSAATIDSALHYIRNNQQEQQQKKRLGLDSTTSNDVSNNDDYQLAKAGGKKSVLNPTRKHYMNYQVLYF